MMTPRLALLISILASTLTFKPLDAQLDSQSSQAAALQFQVPIPDARLVPDSQRRAPADSGSGSGAHWRRGVIGGVIGLVVGLAVCTAISNAINEGTGFSTCTTKGNTMFAAGGFALGFAIGWLTTPRRTPL